MSRPVIQHLTLGDSSFSQIASAMLLFSSVTDEDELDHASLFTSVKWGFLHIPAKRFNPGSRRQSGLGSDPDLGFGEQRNSYGTRSITALGLNRFAVFGSATSQE